MAGIKLWNEFSASAKALENSKPSASVLFIFQPVPMKKDLSSKSCSLKTYRSWPLFLQIGLISHVFHSATQCCQQKQFTLMSDWRKCPVDAPDYDEVGDISTLMASPLAATLNACSTSLNGNSSVINSSRLIDLDAIKSKDLSNDARDRPNAPTIANSL